MRKYVMFLAGIVLTIGMLTETIGATEFLWSTAKVFSGDLSKVPQWKQVLKRHQQQVPRFTESWQSTIRKGGVRGRRDQLDLVQVEVNHLPYEKGSQKELLTDPWYTPLEFKRRGVGDCEEFVVAKYMLLRVLGWDTDQLRLVVVHDSRRDVGHAILVVYLDDIVLVLDNTIPHVVEASAILDYVPLVSMNEKGWWSHTPTLQKIFTLSQQP